jgi:hypothetical protein
MQASWYLRSVQGQSLPKWVVRAMSAFPLPAQPVDATQALNLSAGVSNCKVSRGRSFIRTADRFDPTGVPVRMVWAFKRAFH